MAQDRKREEGGMISEEQIDEALRKGWTHGQNNPPKKVRVTRSHPTAAKALGLPPAIIDITATAWLHPGAPHVSPDGGDQLRGQHVTAMFDRGEFASLEGRGSSHRGAAKDLIIKALAEKEKRA